MRSKKELLQIIIEMVYESTDVSITPTGFREYDHEYEMSDEAFAKLLKDFTALLEVYSSDNLRELFAHQTDLQEKIGSDIYSIEFIKDMFIGIITEACEALETTPWKPWKQSSKWHVNSFKEEIVDLWHFVINLTLASGMSPSELMVRFRRKNRTNHKRQDDGY